MAGCGEYEAMESRTGCGRGQRLILSFLVGAYAHQGLYQCHGTAYVNTPAMPGQRSQLPSACSILGQRPNQGFSLRPRQQLKLRMGVDIPIGPSDPSDKSNDAAKKAVSKASDYEILLAELAFTNPDELPKVVEKNLDKLDDSFYNFLARKIEDTKDADEKETLAVLKDAVTDLMQKILKAAMERGDVSKDDIEAAGLSTSALSLDSYSTADLASATYDAFMQELIKDPSKISTAVEAGYDKIDMRFLERLNEKMQEDGPQKELLTQLNSAIQACMSARIQKASDALQKVLKAGDLNGMRKELMLLNAKGGLDESVILLLEANIDQARKAGAQPAVEVMTMLKDKAIEYKDASMPDEIRLIRKLMRTEDPEVSYPLSEYATKEDEPGKESSIRGSLQTPRKGTERKSQQVNGKRFVNALRDLIANYGNVDEKFLKQIDKIAKEGEQVVTEIYGLNEAKDVQALQNEAFHKRTVSVWELEALEESFEASGQNAPWRGESRGGWDKDGNLIIGGNELKKKGKDGGDSGIIW
ncbi:hypothetical protein GUITHDRAFT_135633 [Guillardia theta CCMP2712]|uniref:Uncharacterized protein n=1 Tax=Guillardia theta (strain CCMP2712) TaxID=905079 RepID=L1JMX7_GUITC|nr:hypothetical protein GUITHDRAFT_135633 [Guillardia theta CCMP2712]EKX49946.1 hypothetical protein GUITHDRAFT_135633 [Guillardia theta CCMP2712]|eukprot:XP_005836926.1 hypothetical protein GUITHDRAFT_135633 [Guillardia theta CCMP2712]